MSTDTRLLNNELYPSVVRGDQVARDEMILLNTPLVTVKVDGLLGCFPAFGYLRDDLIGEANLALVEAVNGLAGKDADKVNPTGYINVAIQRAIGNCLDGELYSDDRGARRNRQQGNEQEQIRKVPNSEFVIGELEHDPRKEADLLELILGCCETDEERAIVDLRRKGYVDAEIARQLDIPLTTTFMLRRELYQRVLATGEVTPD